MSRRRVGLLAVLLLSLVGVAAWKLTRGHNGLGVRTVVLITLDTTRADRMGFLGCDRGLTPRLDRIAAEGVVFERCLSTAPITLPAHASILSGCEPAAHGVRINGAYGFDAANPSLTRELRARGFRTAAFVSAFPLDRRFGLDLEFERYDDRRLDPSGAPDPSARERAGERTVQAALDFVDEVPFAPLFLWVHLFDPHAPYQAPAPYSARFPDPYDAEIAYTDACVGELLDGLKERGRLDDALVCVVGDHGEGLGEHGESTHTIFCYDSTLRVPWLLWSPGRLQPRRIEETVSLADVAPTLLGLLRFAVPAGMTGASAAAAARDGAAAAVPPAVFESQAASYYYGFAPLRGIESEGWKLIDAPRPELFRPREDPGELRNQASERPDVVRRLRALLDQRLARVATPRGARRTGSEVEDVAMRQLGYVSGSGVRPDSGRPLADPKDGIEIFEALQQASLQSAEDRPGAVARLRSLLSRRPDVPEAHELLGDLLVEAGDYAGAAEQYRAARKLNPRNPELWTKEGALLGGPLADPNAAEARLNAALEADPSFLRAQVELGLLLLRTGRVAEARRWFDRVLERSPEVVAARIGRAETLLRMHNVRLAQLDLEAALTADPDNVQALRRMVEVCVLLKDDERALEHRRRLAEVAPEVRLAPEIERALAAMSRP